MTASRTLLRIIAAGGAKSIEQLAIESGLPEAKVRSIVAYQSAYGCLEARPRTFSLTQKGLERANHVTREKRRAEMLANKAPKKAKPLAPVVKPEHIQRRIPNSVFSLGALA